MSRKPTNSKEQRPTNGSSLFDVNETASVSAIGDRICRLTDSDPGTIWSGPEGVAALEARVNRILGAAPNVRFILQLNVDPPTEWLSRNEPEHAGFAIDDPVGNTNVVSWASDRWLRDASDRLATFIKGIARAAWIDRCAGVQIASGAHGDWRHRYAEQLPDVGPRMQARLRAFALDKYRRNEGLLRQAWDFPRATFDRIDCPNVAERQGADLGRFRNPTRRRRVLDYLECLFQAQNVAALTLCRAAGKASAGRLPVGIEFGLDVLDGPGAEDGCRLPESVWSSEDVDFLIARNANAAALGSALLRSKPVLFRSGSPAESKRDRAEIALFVDPSAPFSLASGEAAIGTFGVDQLVQIANLEHPVDTYVISDLFDSKLPDFRLYLFLNLVYLSEAERRRLDAKVKRSGQTAAWFWAPALLGEDGIGAQFGERACGIKLRVEGAQMSLKVRVVASGEPLLTGVHIGSAFGSDQSVAPTITVTDRQATRLGANRSNKTCFAVKRFPEWTSVMFGGGPVPVSILRNLANMAGIASH